MENTIAAILGIILFGLFLYFGYKDDYKRNPKAFVKTIIVIPLGVLTFFSGLFGITSVLQNWTRKDTTTTQNENTSTRQHHNTPTQK